MSDFFDKAKDLLAENSETVDDVVDTIAGFVDDKTDGKHKDQIAQGMAKTKDAIAQFVGDDGAEKPSGAEHAKKTKPETA